MDNIKAMYQDMLGWMGMPFKKDMPIYQLLLIFILFLIVAFVVFDALKLVKMWADAATEAVVETVT